MHCPNCKVDLEGGLIFEHFAKTYSKEKALEIAAMYGATETEGCWGRQIGIETPEYDGVSYWKCPDCGYVWSRFVKDNSLKIKFGVQK